MRRRTWTTLLTAAAVAALPAARAEPRQGPGDAPVAVADGWVGFQDDGPQQPRVVQRRPTIAGRFGAPILVDVPEVWAEVGGPLAPDDAIAVAAGTVGLVLAAAVSDATPVAEWETARRGPHVRFRFAAPHDPIRVDAGPDVALDELLVPVLPNRDPTGCVLVRAGSRVVRFAGFTVAAEFRFREVVARAGR